MASNRRHGHARQHQVSACTQTSNFTVTAGMHTIKFLGLKPLGGDNTAFVDLVRF